MNYYIDLSFFLKINNLLLLFFLMLIYSFEFLKLNHLKNKLYLILFFILLLENCLFLSSNLLSSIYFLKFKLKIYLSLN